MTRFALLLTVLAACSKDNPYYCEGSDCELMPDAAGSGSNVCVTSDDCSGTAATPVCNTVTGSCVACSSTEIGACAGTTPICAAATNTCGGCTEHDECSTSHACLPTGACGTNDEVAYVASTGMDTNPCTHDSPCLTLSHAAGLKPYVKLEGDLAESVTLAGVDVVVLAEPGTVIHPATVNSSPVITISGDSNVTLKNVIIRDGVTGTGHGILINAGQSVTLTLEDVSIINNDGYGLSMGSGTLDMSRSLVATNDLGGADLTGTFKVTSSIFAANGSPTALFGGVRLSPAAASASFAFNTIADNVSNTNPDLGISCTSSLITLTSSLVSGNTANGCTFEYSMFDNGTAGITSPNKTGNASFKSNNALDPLGVDFYRIYDTSDAIDSGAPTSAVMTDIDGDSRPQGGVRDIGADEYL